MRTATIALLAILAVLMTAAPAVALPAMACGDDEPCAPQWDGEDDDRLVDIEREEVDLNTGEVIITFITASGKLVTIRFGGFQPTPEPQPTYYYNDQGQPAWDATPVDDWYFG